MTKPKTKATKKRRPPPSKGKPTAKRYDDAPARAVIVDDMLNAGAEVRDVIAFLPQRYVERFPVAELVEYPGNPKSHDLGVIHESIDANGFYGLLLVQDWPNTPHYILAGNGRKATLDQKGQTHAPVLLMQCDARTARRIVLIDNRASERGGFDQTSLATYLTEQTNAGDLGGTGYDIDDVTTLLRDVGTPLSAITLGSFVPPEPDENGELAQPAPTFRLYSVDRVIDEAFTFFRARGFPYRAVPLHVQLQEMNKLAALTQDAAQRSTAGYAVADTYHPHRFDAAANGMRAPSASFTDDVALKKAIRMKLTSEDHQRGSVGTEYFGSLSLVNGTQACANFRPAFAMHLYRRYGVAGGRVLDPCTGYGGRLVGWLASMLGGEYVGIDPNVPTCAGNKRLSDVLLPQGCGVKLLCEAAEDALPREQADSYDFVFTSPPYFAKELYAADDTQSWVRYKTIDAWREFFLDVLIAESARVLKRGAHLVINIADVGDQRPALRAHGDDARRTHTRRARASRDADVHNGRELATARLRTRARASLHLQEAVTP